MSEFTNQQKELSSKLTNLQRAFVVNLIGGMSQRQAVKKAGSKAKTDSALDQVASTMLSNIKVRDFYDSLIEAKAINNIMTRDEALKILSNNARVKMTDVADYEMKEIGRDEEGNPVLHTVWTMKDSKDIDPDIIACIRSVTMTRQGPKIELHDQQGAIKQLSTMQGWEAPKKSEITGKDGEAIEVASVSASDMARRVAFLLAKGEKESAE